MHKRTLILADLHLTRHTPEAVSRDLVRLVEAHRGAKLVFAGDLFDLSADAVSSRDTGIEEGLRRYPDVARSFAEHLDRDGELYVVSGNHDAEMGTGNMPASIADVLGVQGGEARARIHTTPWFFRLGNVHVEHGHLYDPDNAPAHPLVVSARSLGVHFVEQFIAPTGAFAFLNANDNTPLKLLRSSFAWYGKRAPYVIYRFFHAATTALCASGPFFEGERARAAAGQERLPSFAAAQGLSTDAAERVLALRAVPTLESMRRTFARLYLDRVFATVGVAGGLTALGLGHPLAGGIFASAGAAIMAASWATGHDRYKGTVTERLERGARAVAEASGAKLVVFGHTHREAIGGTYANTGSFAFPGRAPGRPFLEIEGSLESPRVARRYFTG